MSANTLRWCLLLVFCAGFAAACGDTTNNSSEIPQTPTTTSTAPTTTAPAATTPTQATVEISVDRNVAFTSDLERTYGGYVDVFHPTSDGPWPVVILLHGASDPRFDATADASERTTGGCPIECEAFYDAHASYLARHGTVVFNLRYDWRAPAEMRRLVDDVSCVGSFVVVRAPRYGGDPTRTVVVGHSRGATIGAALAFSDFAAPPAAECVERTDERPKTVGFVGLSGDYQLHGAPAPADDTKIVIPIVGTTTFSESDEISTTGVTAGQAYQAASGYAWLQNDPLPPVELFYGTAETDAAPADAERFAVALSANGHDPNMTAYEGEHWQSLYLPENPQSPPTAANLLNLSAILRLAHS